MNLNEVESFKDASPALVLNHEYLSRRYAQLFMANYNVFLPPPVLARINQYIVLAVNGILEDESILCPPTPQNIEAALELRMNSNTLYHKIIKSIRSPEKSNLNQNFIFKSNKKKHSSLIDLLPFNIFKGYNQPKITPVGPTRPKRGLVLEHSLSTPNLVSFNSNTEVFKKQFNDCPSYQNNNSSRAHMTLIAPWQVMYHCSTSDAFGSRLLLAHIEMTGAVLSALSAQFLGTFISHLTQNILMEISQQAQISRLSSVTLSTLDEVFHDSTRLKPIKFPIFAQFKATLSKEGFQNSQNQTMISTVPPKKDTEAFVPSYISKYAASKLLLSFPSFPTLSSQSLSLINRFLDEVVIGLANKLSASTTLSQLQAALNLTLKCCPLVVRAFHKLERVLPSLMAVPVRPLVTDSIAGFKHDRNILSATTRGHYYRLITHYFSPLSDLYQSRKLSAFFSTQPPTLDTQVARYLAAIIGQLGEEVLKLGIDRLKLDMNCTASELTTHQLVPGLAGALPQCVIATKLQLFHFPHIDPFPQQPRFSSTDSSIPSLRTSNDSCSSASIQCDNPLSNHAFQSGSTETNSHKKNNIYLNNSISLPRLGLNLTPYVKSHTMDPAKFDDMLRSNTTLQLSLTPNHMSSIGWEIDYSF